MTDELILNLLDNVPVIIVLLLWIKAERESHANDVEFYRNMVAQMVALAFNHMADETSLDE